VHGHARFDPKIAPGSVGRQHRISLEITFGLALGKAWKPEPGWHVKWHRVSMDIGAGLNQVGTSRFG
jgi:hypothetical protein